MALNSRGITTDPLSDGVRFPEGAPVSSPGSHVRSRFRLRTDQQSAFFGLPGHLMHMDRKRNHFRLRPYGAAILESPLFRCRAVDELGSRSVDGRAFDDRLLVCRLQLLGSPDHRIAIEALR